MAVLILGLTATSSWGQEEELELIETVTELQQQLDAEDVADRDAAEAKMIELGAVILEYLEPATKESTTDFRERIARIRTTLEKNAANLAATASTLTLQGKMTVGDALKKIARKTRNEVAVADDSILDKPIELDLEDAEFWTVLQEIMKQAKLAVDRYGSEKPGQLMLAPSAEGVDRAKLPVAHSKIFQTQILRIDSSVNLEQPQLDFTTVNLLVRWEPRLRPISVDIPMSSVKVVDEFGEAVALKNPDQVNYGMVQPEIPEVEFSLNFPRIDRQVETLKSITAKINTVLPGRVETFRMKKVGSLKPGFQQKKAGANLTFGGTRKNEDVYSVKLSLSFDEENNALESHQSWVFQNQVYLQDSQGKQEQALSLETFQQDNTVVTIVYYFLEEPGDRTLVYKTPATIVKLPVDIELTKIPLP